MTWLCPLLEFLGLLPGVVLAYFPVRDCLRRPAAKWQLPLFAAAEAIAGGAVCRWLNLPTVWGWLLLLPLTIGAYARSVRISRWKSVNVGLSVCAVFACLYGLARAYDAALPQGDGLWLCLPAGLAFQGSCWLFVLAAWYPASHWVKKLIEDENLAQTWYVFWVLPLLFLGLEVYLTLRAPVLLNNPAGIRQFRIAQVGLLALLGIFYTLFFLMADSLNRNARLQQENQFLSMQQSRYETLKASIEETRQARHDLRHHIRLLAALADSGDLTGIRNYLAAVQERVPSTELVFCENGTLDGVIGFYCTLAQREGIPLSLKIDLPRQLPVDEIDLCLVLSNLLENALEASRRAPLPVRHMEVAAYGYGENMVLVQVVNAYAGEIRERRNVFQSSKRAGDGVGLQSVRRIAEKNGGAAAFSYADGIFTARIMLRGKP